MHTILALMKEALINPSAALAVLIIFLFFLHKWMSSSSKNLPPSPPRLPVIGNIHQVGMDMQRSLRTLSLKYGDLMLLHLGYKPTIVVSSAEGACEVLKTHDATFADRPPSTALDTLMINGKDIASSRWKYAKKLKTICLVHLLSNKNVVLFRQAREEEASMLVQRIREYSAVNINLTDAFESFSYHLVFKVTLGRRGAGATIGREFDFRKMAVELFEVVATVFVKDLVPWLGWIDRLRGANARLKKVARDIDSLMERIVDEHLERPRGGDDNPLGRDFVDVLLEVLRTDTSLDRESIKGLLLDMLLGGADTTNVVLQWMMSELIKNPRVMKELQKEVRGLVIEDDNKALSEDDLVDMHYLKAVIKETLRLHPPGPLLIPHECSKDVKIDGYDIPSGSQVLVNVWSIARDPRYWENAEDFLPQRFLNSSIDFNGHHFHYIPFGSGRRMCPGMSFACATLEVTMANLIYHFDWALPDGAHPESLDMAETSGLVASRKNHLILVPTPRIC